MFGFLWRRLHLETEVRQQIFKAIPLPKSLQFPHPFTSPFNLTLNPFPSISTNILRSAHNSRSQHRGLIGLAAEINIYIPAHPQQRFALSAHGLRHVVFRIYRGPYSIRQRPVDLGTESILG